MSEYMVGQRVRKLLDADKNQSTGDLLSRWADGEEEVWEVSSGQTTFMVDIQDDSKPLSKYSKAKFLTYPVYDGDKDNVISLVIPSGC